MPCQPQEALDPDPASYKCFNDFFVRRLKPSARPIAAPDNPDVIVSAADCRCVGAWVGRLAGGLQGQRAGGRLGCRTAGCGWTCKRLGVC